MTENKSRKIIFIITGLIIMIAAVWFDQFTKNLAVYALKGHSDIIIIDGILQLHYLENTGAAFSMLEGKQTFFAILTPILLLVMLYVFIKIPYINRFKPISFIVLFVMAGAIGNYIDRIVNHYVVDFIYFSLINFPVFNVADCYVTVSIILFVILMIFYYKDEDFEIIKNNLRFK